MGTNKPGSTDTKEWANHAQDGDVHGTAAERQPTRVDALQYETTVTMTLGKSNQYVIDPVDGTSLHWCHGSLPWDELNAFVPQCDQLCRICLNLAKDVYGLVRYHPGHAKAPDMRLIVDLDHHNNMGTLNASAAAGCHFCALLNECRREELPEQAIRDSSSYTLKIRRSIAPMLWLEVGGHAMKALYLVRAVFTGEPQMTLSCSSTRDPKVLDLAKRWLDRCTEKHILCRGPEATPYESWCDPSRYIPTRLLRVKASKGVVESVRLVIHPEVGSTRGYLTLSHCWGGANITELKQASLEQFQRQIPLSELPQNFSDALLVCVHLGFEFLWIDSLCIIQDSAIDWELESQQMGNTYRHSQCTIAAVKAADSHGGLFTERSALPLAPCQLVGGLEGGVPDSVYVETMSRAPRPLYKRGWVIQEQCLSRRILAFEAEQVSLTCVSGSATEQTPKFIGHSDHPSLSSLVADALAARAPAALKSHSKGNDTTASTKDIRDDADHWIHRWWDIVNKYTECDLTFASDRFPAIRGLVNLIEDAKHITMTYGLWRPYLDMELLWYSDKPAAELLSIDVPSWSWLSAGFVHNHCFHSKDRFENKGDIETHDVASVSLDLSADSANEPRTLSITGQMLRVAISPAMSAQQFSKVEDSIHYPFRLEDGRSLKIPENLSVWDGDWKPDKQYDPTWEPWALQVLQETHYRNQNRTHSASVGLIVVPVDDKLATYKRIGFYYTTWDHVEASDKDYFDGEPYLKANRWATRDGQRWFGEVRSIRLI